MKNPKFTTIFTIISFLLISILSIYIMGFRINFYLPVWVFWLCILGIFPLITFQIIKIQYFLSKQYILIIIQILLTATLIRLLFISPENVLIGYDSYNELISLSQFDNLGYWNADAIKGSTANYPIIYVFGMLISKLLNISLIATVKWFPLSIFYIGSLVMYLIGNLKYSKKAGLLAMLGFSFIYISLFFHSAFQRETIAVIIMLLSFYTYLEFVYQKRKNIKYFWGYLFF